MNALKQTTLWEIACVIGALVMVVLVTIWGAWQSVADARRAALVSEISPLKFHGARTAARIEHYLSDAPDRTLHHLPQAPWIAQSTAQFSQQETTYSAVIDSGGEVVMHSNPDLIGERYDRRWFERLVPDAGPDVVTTRNASLTGGMLAYDITTPILLRQEPIGSYHVGINADMVDAAVAARAEAAPRKWIIAGGMIFLIIGGAGYSLSRLATRAADLKKAVGLERTQRLTELGRLAAMLAHEIRNPINAIRMNLYMMGRLVKDPGQLSADEADNILRDSNAEIERLERLIRSVLAYARPGEANIETIDLNREIRATVAFIRPLLDRDGISIEVNTPDRRIEVDVDRDRLRQSLLNLLNNAHDACTDGGRIEVALEPHRGWVDLAVRDSGPGIRPSDRDRVFDPFFTTKKNGCGLGLAMVRRFAEESNGRATCKENGHNGAEFRIALPVKNTLENRKQRP